MKTVIVSYRVRPSKTWFYVREEGTPNRRNWATRFESVAEAEKATGDISDTVASWRGNTPEFRFETFEA